MPLCLPVLFPTAHALVRIIYSLSILFFIGRLHASFIYLFSLLFCYPLEVREIHLKYFFPMGNSTQDYLLFTCFRVYSCDMAIWTSIA